MSNHLVITLIATDRPGIVEQVAQTISQFEGNWLESSFSRLGGKFAGILLVNIDASQQSAFEQALHKLADNDIRVSVELAGQDVNTGGEHFTLSLVGNDRRGIVGEISQVLAQLQVNVDKLDTFTENAPMSGELLFHVSANIILPQHLCGDSLQTALEDLSDDLIVELEDSP